MKRKVAAKAGNFRGARPYKRAQNFLEALSARCVLNGVCLADADATKSDF